MWSDAIDDYGRWLLAGGRSAGTVRLWSTYLARLAGQAPAGPETVSTAQLVAFLARPGWSAETRRSARAAVVGFFRWYTASGLLEVSPATGLPSVRVPRRCPRPAPDSTVSRALAAASDRDRLMLLLAAAAGLRRGEIARVRVADVLDMPAGRELRVRGKGGHVRHVPLVGVVDRELLIERARRRAGGHGSGYRYGSTFPPTVEGFLFPGADGGHLSVDRVGRILARLLGDGWTAHTLRHRFATRAYAAQRDLLAVRDLLGHSSVATTQIYTATPAGALRAAAEAAA